MTYQEFLKEKQVKSISSGFDAGENEINPALFDFQKDIVRWALKKGRAAVLIGCGCGKTVIQMQWAELVRKHTGGNILIVAPLNVVMQTVEEGEKFGFTVHPCRTQADVRPGISITNYEMIEHFDASEFVGVALDESSILKSFTSKSQQLLTEMFAGTRYKLLLTATISPNDYTEIGTSAEFLGIMSRTEMLATYFVHDGGNTSVWRLKKAGEDRFWEWFATWAICFNNPNELGYEIEGYKLPDLNFHTIMIKSEVGEYEMFVRAAETLQERREARKESMQERTDKAAELTETEGSQWLLWVDYNDESDMLRRKIDGSVEVKGSDSPEFKAESSIQFADGVIRCLVSKPSIFGFGSNFQSCHNMIFCGLSDSYERFYQAVRRCWRFGQKEPVNVYIIISEKEVNILDNIKSKQARMDEMQARMTAKMKDTTMAEIRGTERITESYIPEQEMKIPAFMRKAI